jgi:hypothetical protein
MDRTTAEPARNENHRKAWPAALIAIHVLALQFLFPVWARSAARAPQQPGVALGSLSTFGEVFVNDAPAPLDSTIFSGDAVRTGGAGTATFTLSGKGSLKITSNTQVVFTGAPQYVGELKSGSVVMSSLSGATGINLRTGNSVVVAVTEGEQSTSNIDMAADGSFFVSCLDGSVGVIPLQGANGIFIQAGQSVSISPQGDLSTEKRPITPPEAPASPATTTPPAVKPKKNNTRWIIVGAAGAGAVGVAAALAAHGGSPVSPSAP